MRMAWSRMRESWNHTAAIMTLIENVNRDPKSSPRRVSDNHPFAIEDEIIESAEEPKMSLWEARNMLPPPKE